jgi:hypothetical protein
MLLKKPGPRGGKVLKKSGPRGPYLLKIVTGLDLEARVVVALELEPMVSESTPRHSLTASPEEA